MVMNGIGVVQNCYKDKANQIHNEYHLYSSNNVHLGAMLFPSNGQLLDDAYALNKITKVLAERWGLTSQSKRGQGKTGGPRR